MVFITEGFFEWHIYNANLSEFLIDCFLIRTTSDNGRSIHVIPRISIEEQLREVRIQKGVQFKEYYRPHSETKTLEEKSDTYPPNTYVLMGDSILNGIIERNLSNGRSVKVRKFPGATVDDLRHYALPIIRKQPNLFNYSRRN